MKVRFWLLDLLRWLLATYVIFFHFWAWTKEDVFWDSKQLTVSILQFGYISVDVFFIISGIAIAASVLNKTPKEFISSRVKRLIPTFIFVSLIETFVTLLIQLRGNYVSAIYSVLSTSTKNLLPVSGKDSELRNFVAWSLGIEIQFYVLVLLGILVSLWYFKDTNLNLLNFCRLITALLYLAGLSNLKGISSLAISVYLPYFLLGIYLWCVSSKDTGINKPKLIDLLTLVPILSQTISIRLASATIPNNEVIGATIFLALFLIILVSLMVKTPKIDYPSKTLGNSSYALYLLGGFTSIFLFTNLKDNVGILASSIIVYLFACITSILYQVFLDQKFQRILFLKIEI